MTHSDRPQSSQFWTVRSLSQKPELGGWKTHLPIRKDTTATERGCHSDRSHLPGRGPFAGMKKSPGGNHSLRRRASGFRGRGGGGGQSRGCRLTPGAFLPRVTSALGRGAVCAETAAQHVFPPWRDRDAHPFGPHHLVFWVILPGSVCSVGLCPQPLSQVPWPVEGSI